jgi:elongation factor G
VIAGEASFSNLVRAVLERTAIGRKLRPADFLFSPRSRKANRAVNPMLDKVRNIGIIAHVDAGKTTTTERILYYSGTKHKVGDVDDGDTTTDFDPLERAKGITINSAAVSIDWADRENNHIAINIIDTPGHVDFTAEVERSLRVLDGGVCVFCAVGGVEVQSETVWFQANKYKVPRIAYVNKLDRLGADFHGCVKQMIEKLRVVPAICTIPAGEDQFFTGIIDLIRMKYVLKDASDKTHRNYTFVEIPDEFKADAEKYRTLLIDAVSAVDDHIMELALEGHDVPEDLIRKALRKGTLEGKFTPIHCGSSKNFQGVQLLLDAVVDYLPNPLDRGAVDGIVPKTKETVKREPNVDAPFSGLAFKTVAEAQGDLVYVRIYSGTLHLGETVMNTTTGKEERIARMYRMMGNTRQDKETALPGEIVAVMGLKNTYTGNTLCATNAIVALESINFPKPVISQRIIPDGKTDSTKMAEALARLTRDDPTLKFHTDEETKDLILSGMGELHLEVSIDKLHRFPGVKVVADRPRVAYRQTIAKPVVQETRYIKQSGGSGKFAVIVVEYRPLDADGIEAWKKKMLDDGEQPDVNNVYFSSKIVGGVVPREYIGPVEAGIRDIAKKGAKYGFPVVDVEAVLVDGKTHPVDSSADAFKLAGMESFREVQAAAGIKLLEPIMNVVVVSPEDNQGAICGDISRRRGLIEETTSDKGRSSIKAKIPLANLVGYTSDLRGATSGKASFSMEFSHYQEVREDQADLPKDMKK